MQTDFFELLALVPSESPNYIVIISGLQEEAGKVFLKTESLSYVVIPALGEAACQPVIWEASQPRDVPHSCGATYVSTGLLVGLSAVLARLTLGTVASPLGHPVTPYPMVNCATSGAVGPLIIMVVGWSLSLAHPSFLGPENPE